MMTAETASEQKDAEPARTETTASSPETELSGSQAGAVAARWFGHELLSHPANASVRNLAMRRAQQTHGNRFVQRMMSKAGTGPMPARVIQRQCACGGTCGACKSGEADFAAATPEGVETLAPAVDEYRLIQPKAGALGQPELPADVDLFPPGGEPLDRQTRGFMESRMGADLGAVRVHADSQAAGAASDLNAEAYTSGRDIYFGAGRYEPKTSEGKKLLAHELTHTIQQAENPPAVQGKLRVSQPNDADEREADLIADEVMRMPEDGSAGVSRSTSPLSVQRKCAECEDGEKLHRSETGTAPAVAPPIVHETLSSPGRPLPNETRAFFEPRFGADFSSVQIHDGPQAADSATSVRARAYTVGNSIVFNAGQFSPNSESGKELLAHELTHVVQQSGGVEGAVNGVAQPKLMRALPFSSTLSICHRVLKSREFKVDQGGVIVTANARWGASEEWEGEGPPPCGSQPYHITLTQLGVFWDSEYGTCPFESGKPNSKEWANIPEDTYYLTIFVNEQGPACCLSGEIEVSQQSGISGDSCTKPPPGPLEIIHTGLDLAGLIPALGVVPDIVNAGLYLIEGDWTNAGVSAIGVVPYIGGAVVASRAGKMAIKIAARDVEKLGAEGIARGLREARAAEKEALSEAKAATKESEEAGKLGGKTGARLAKLAGCRIGSLYCPISYLHDEFAALFSKRESAEFYAYLRRTAELDLNLGRSLRRDMTILTGDPMYIQFMREVPRSQWSEPFREAVDQARRLDVDYRELNLGNQVARWPLDDLRNPWVVHHDPPLGWVTSESSDLWHPMPYREHQSADSWWRQLLTSVKDRLKESGISKDTIKEIFGREDALDIRDL